MKQYLEQLGDCKFNAKDIAVTLSNQVRIQPNPATVVNDIKETLVKYGPVAAVFSVSKEWNEFT